MAFNIIACLTIPLKTQQDKGKDRGGVVVVSERMLLRAGLSRYIRQQTSLSQHPCQSVIFLVSKPPDAERGPATLLHSVVTSEKSTNGLVLNPPLP